MPVPGMGWFSTCEDPHGNEFMLWQTDTSAPAPSGEPVQLNPRPACSRPLAPLREHSAWLALTTDQGGFLAAYANRRFGRVAVPQPSDRRTPPGRSACRPVQPENPAGGAATM